MSRHSPFPRTAPCWPPARPTKSSAYGRSDSKAAGPTEGSWPPAVLIHFLSRGDWPSRGVGLSRQDIREQGLAIPEADYLAETAEEQLVMYADKFHSKTRPPTFLTADSYATYLARFGAAKVEAFALLRAQFGEPDLTSARDQHNHPQA